MIRLMEGKHTVVTVTAIQLAKRMEPQQFNLIPLGPTDLGSIFPPLMCNPANQFSARAKHNQISPEERARHVTKLFCGVAAVFMQENRAITFIHTGAANPFY